MSRKIFIRVVFSALVLSFLSCGDRCMETLTVCDSLCYSNPKKALSLLGGMKADVEKAPERVRMYYDLVRIKAKNKMYQPIVEDSVIMDVLKYCEANKVENTMLSDAYFYAGRYSFDNGDAPEALEYFQKSLSALEGRGDRRREALINSQLGYVLDLENFHDKALIHYRKAYKNDKMLGDVSGCMYDLRDIADCYSDKNLYDSAVVYYREASLLAEKCKDSVMYHSIMCFLADEYFMLGKFGTAKDCIVQSLEGMSPETEGRQFVVAGKIYYELNMPDSSAYFFKKVLNVEGGAEDRGTAHLYLASLCLEKGNVCDAISHINSYRILEDSIVKYKDAEVIAQMDALYGYGMKNKQLYSLRAENKVKKYLIVFLSVVIVLFVVFCFLMIKSNRQKRLLLKLKIDKLELMKHKWENMDSGTKKRNAEGIADSDICRKINLCLNSPDECRLRLSDDDWNLLEQVIEKFYPGFRGHLFEMCKMNTQDFHVCMLIKVGISPSNIAMLTNRSREAITACRRRLYVKAFCKKGTPKDWDMVILSI